MVFQMLYDLSRWLLSLIWTSDKNSTVELGTFTGISEEADLSMPPLKRQKRFHFHAEKPPLAPKRRKRRRVPAVLYIDDDYWDARMTDVD